MKVGRLVVKPYSPWRAFFSFLAAILILYLSFWIGQQSTGSLSVVQETGELQQQTINTLKVENQLLTEQVAILKRSLQVDSEANSEVKNNLKQQQEEILELREEVTFYRGIVSPGERASGLQIDNFIVSPTQEEGLFHYELVLVQALKNDKYVRGVTVVTIEGLQEGKSERISLTSMATGKKKKQLKFKFRYFQKFEGYILVPPNFSPRAIEVVVKPHKRKNMKRLFDWSSDVVAVIKD